PRRIEECDDEIDEKVSRSEGMMSSVSPEMRAGAGEVSVTLVPASLRAWRGPIASAAVLAALLLWLFWDFFYKQFRFSTEFVDEWGHVLLIPFIAGYFVYLKRDALLRTGLRTNWLGLIPIIAGTAWYFVATLGPASIRHHIFTGAGVFVVIV